jgi:hypothetical protein
MRVIAVVVLLGLAACGDSDSGHERVPAGSAPAEAGSAPVAAVTPDAAVKPEPARSATKPGRDFLPEIAALYRVVGCGHPEQPLPESMTHGDAARAAKLKSVVDRHCNALQPRMDKYRADYFDKARAWFVAHEPKDLPKSVVYAFGGGDLVSALVAFPDATEITTISLELSGDPRKIESLTPEQLDQALAGFRTDIGLLIDVGSNLSTSLSDQQRSSIAAQLSSHLLGMATGGYEPVAARYFSLDDAGAIHYFTAEEIDADTKPGTSLSGSWKAPSFARSFYNVEIDYRAPNDPTVRTFRHIGWNLGNDYLAKHGELLAHLHAKGKVAICVKGGSYLLWRDDFSTFRQYLTDDLAWMITDSTGVAPNFVDASKLQQDAYGHFDGPPRGYGFESLDGSKADVAFRKLWSHPKDRMPFRFGYLDRNKQSHVVITYPVQ